VTVSKDGARYQPVAWWFTKRRLGRDLHVLGSPTASTFAEGRDNGEQITVWGRLRVSMKTAAEYRVMADKCFKWARNTYMDEARETYLQLAQFWLDVASKLDGPPGSQQV
jgi:hypothetical protein